jgi:hypothetical protein
MKKHLYLLATIACCLSSCTKETFREQNFVVEAFLFADENKHQIRIKEVEPLTVSEPQNIPILNAQVILTKGSQTIELAYNTNTKQYEDVNNNLVVNTGDNFEISVKVGDKIATGKTTVPKATSGLTISRDLIVVPPITIRQGIADEIRALFSSASFQLRWSNPNNELHFMVIESVIEEDLIFPEDFPIPTQTLALIQSFRFITAPTVDTVLQIPSLSLGTYGRFKAKVYRVNQEYADLYNSSEQDSRDLNAPPSNIRNAVGIFSAFAADSVFFNVVKK